MMIQGKVQWFKVLGKPVEGYEKGEKDKQWEFDIVLTPALKAQLEALEFPGKVREYKDGTEYIKFTKKAYNKDGEANKPIRVVGPTGEDWDRSIMIGNGSTVNVKFNIQDWEFGKKTGKRVSILAVQVWYHEPYEGGEQFPVREAVKKPLGEEWNEEDEG